MTEAETALARRIGAGVRRRRDMMKPTCTQENLAERTGLYPVYISEVENGKRSLSVSVCARIADALGTRLSELFTEIGE